MGGRTKPFLESQQYLNIFYEALEIYVYINGTQDVCLDNSPVDNLHFYFDFY